MDLRAVPVGIREYILPQTDGCWRWVGKVDPNGYGRAGKGWAHRVVYEAVVGPIPDGLQIDHLCCRPLCVNPGHLEPVTPLENFMRGNHPSAISNRSGLCKRGHLLSEHGAYRKGRGRYCKECRRQQQREHYARQEWPSMRAKKGWPR